MKRVLIALVMLALLPAAAANATQVWFVGTGYGESMSTVLEGTISRTGYVGQIMLSFTSDKDTNPFAGYCLTLNQTLTDPETVDIRSLSALPDTSSNSVNNNPPYADPGSGSKIAWLLNTYAASVHSNVAGAALQIALWEVEYDTTAGYNLSTGDFKVSGDSSVISLAQSYLTALGNNTSDATWLDSYTYNANGQKVQAGQDYGVPVPEPTSMVLLGGGLICLAAVVRRRARR